MREEGSHRSVPHWLLAEKDLRVAAIFFDLRPRQILDPHQARYLSYILVSVGFRFRLVRYSGILLSSPDATLLFIPRADRIFWPVSRGEISFKRFSNRP